MAVMMALRQLYTYDVYLPTELQVRCNYFSEGVGVDNLPFRLTFYQGMKKHTEWPFCFWKKVTEQQHGVLTGVSVQNQRLKGYGQNSAELLDNT